MTIDYNCACDDDYPKQTLAQIRGDLLTMMGYSAQTPGPGIVTLYNKHLDLAQKQLYRRYAVLRTKRWFTWPMLTGVRFYDLPGNAETLQIPAPTTVPFSTASTGGTLAPGTYFYRVSATNAYGETLASAELSQVVPAGTSTNTVTVNWLAPTVPTGVSPVTGYNIYGRTTGAEQLIATLGLVLTYTDSGSVAPSGAVPTLNTTQECSKTLDPRQVSWVGISQGDGNWRQLDCGIDPVNYTTTNTSIPQRYAIRQCIEVFPPPSDDTWSLRVMGDFGLQAFAADTDYTTLDPEAILLMAVANLKAHDGAADAGNYMAQLAAYLGDLTAATHLTRRYIPGVVRQPNAVQPKMAS